MRSALLLIANVFVLIIVFAVYRTGTHFTDTQYRVVDSLPLATLDEQGVVSRFSTAIQFQTISHDDRSKFDPEPFIALHNHMETSFPLVHSQAEKTVINDYSLIYHLPGSDSTLKPVLFMGHMDVVPVDENTIDQWQEDPFGGAVEEGVIWGRGTIDDKVSVFALMESMELFLKTGETPKRSIYFAFGHDEEIGGGEGAQSIAKHFESLGLRFEYVLDEGGLVTNGMLQGVNAPVAMVGVAEKGFLNLRLVVEDEGGHSSQPPNHTAVGVVSKAVVALENNQFPADMRFLQMTFDAIGYYTEYMTRLPMSNLWLLSPVVENMLLSAPSTAASLRTTTAATMMEGSSKSNILPTQANAVVNFRLLPGTSINDVVAHAHNTIDDPRVKIEPFMGSEASPISSIDTFGYRMISRNIRRLDSDILVAPYLVQGGTDSKYFYGLSDNVYRFMFIRLNPESFKRFHGVNEQIPVSDYLEAIQFYYAMLSQSARN